MRGLAREADSAVKEFVVSTVAMLYSAFENLIGVYRQRWGGCQELIVSMKKHLSL